MGWGFCFGAAKDLAFLPSPPPFGRETARTAPQRLTRLQQWAVTTAARRGHNKAAIALANKMARIVWAVWAPRRRFSPTPGADHRSVEESEYLPKEMLSEDADHGMTGRTGTEPGR